MVNASTGTDITVTGGTNRESGVLYSSLLTANGATELPTTTAASREPSGRVTFSGTSAVLTQLVSGVPAHCLTFDPFTGDIIINNGTEIKQFDPTSGHFVSTVTVAAGEQSDQCAADGRGHLFCVSNGGHLVGVDFDASGLIGTGTITVAFLASCLHDVAPLSGIGGPPTLEPASLALLATGLHGFGLLGCRRNRV